MTSQKHATLSYDRVTGSVLRAALLVTLLSAIGYGQQTPGMMLSTPGPQSVTFANGQRGPMQVSLGGITGMEITLPMNNSGLTYSRRSGLQLTIDAGWPGHYGYRPVKVTVRVKKPTVAAKRISIRFTTGDYYNKGRAVTAEEEFTLPQGATSATAELNMPQYAVWQLCSWELRVDGQVEDTLTVKQMNFSIAQNPSGPGTPGALIATGMTATEAVGCQSALQGAFNGQVIAVTHKAEADLPKEWIQYSSLDVLIMPAAKLPDLVKKYPEQAEALLRWVNTGGNLWLIDAGRRWEELASVNAALDEQSADDEGATDGELPQGWKYAPLNERAVEPAEGALLLSGFDTGADAPTLRQAVTGIQQQFTGAPANSRRWFAVRGYGLGAVVAFRGTIDPRMGGNGGSVNPTTQSLLTPRVSWETRHGNQPSINNVEFNNLLIPNVGVAPVGQFQFLITLFVLIIGPLNYWLLKRRNKLPLLLATVPVAAAITTVLLFSYGLLADGFGVRVRARTLTLLDQRAGEGVSWGRLSYYAGIAPRGGFTIPVDQAMYPIYPQWSMRYRYGGGAKNSLREVLWEDEQRLTRGWLQSRTPTQYHAVAARPTSKKLELRNTKDGLRIVNRLGVDVSHLAVQDHDGKFYWCENLAQDKGLVVAATDHTAVAVQIRRLFTDNLPEFPSGEDANYGGTYYGFQLSQSLMEARLEAINSPLVSGWGDGKYIAFTKQAVELDLGVDAASEESSFHVIEGSW